MKEKLIPQNEEKNINPSAEAIETIEIKAETTNIVDKTENCILLMTLKTHSQRFEFISLNRTTNGICFYPIDTLQVVGVVRVPDEATKTSEISKNNERFLKNLALVQVPNNKDQVVVYEGQQIGKEGGIVKKINFDSIDVQLQDKEIKMEVIKR